VVTRIEIDGFKTFRGFELELRPFMVIAGANATGSPICSTPFNCLRGLPRTTCEPR
jgi:predicted ATPase